MNDEIHITTIEIDELNPAEYNPRIMPTDEMTKLKKGLQTHGLVDPIIIDLTDNNTVIGGHQRLEALRELYPNKEMELTLIKVGDIGLVMHDTNLRIKDKNDQKALNLSLNRINGTWDTSKLDELLNELAEQHYDIELTGFDEYDLLGEGNTFDTDLELIDELEDDGEDMLNFEESSDEDTYITNIRLGSQKQRTQLVELMAKLQEENPTESKPQLLINYLKEHMNTNKEQIEPYMLIFDDKQQKMELDRLLSRMNDLKRYNSHPIIQAMYENEEI